MTAIIDRLADVLQVWLRRTGAILCYHGMTSLGVPASGSLHLPATDFAATLELLHNTWTTVPLEELVRRHEDGRTTKGLVAITFDDAYATILGVAADLIAQETIPITVFPVGGALTSGSRFWWDRVDDVFPSLAPARWRQFEDACGLPEAYRRGQPSALGPLRPLRQWILAGFHGRWPQALSSELEELEREAQRSTVQRSMSVAELTALAARAPIYVGVHTVTHPVLPFLSDAEVEREIMQCFDLISERCPNPVPILAVPYGLADARTVKLARACGMISSLSLAGSALRSETSVEWLPRICLSAGVSRWKLNLRLAGATGRPWFSRTEPHFPALPSATT